MPSAAHPLLGLLHLGAGQREACGALGRLHNARNALSLLTQSPKCRAPAARRCSCAWSRAPPAPAQWCCSTQLRRLYVHPAAGEKSCTRSWCRLCGCAVRPAAPLRAPQRRAACQGLLPPKDGPGRTWLCVRTTAAAAQARQRVTRPDRMQPAVADPGAPAPQLTPAERPPVQAGLHPQTKPYIGMLRALPETRLARRARSLIRALGSVGP